MSYSIQKLHKEHYPFLLRQVKGMPESFDIAGNLPDDNHKFLCVIGSRTHSTYGLDICKHLIFGLKNYPVVIVSGLAVGIDSAAHEAALNVGLKTIAFPGSGLHPSVLYPPSKLDLAQRIIESGGALLSRFNAKQAAADWTFVSRNQLMAAASHAILVIEGRKGSGTLWTTQYAEKLNRDVLAVPGPISSDLSYGPHMLIRTGSKMITSSADILLSLGIAVRSNPELILERVNSPDINIQQKKILQCLLHEPMSSSLLMDKLKLSPSEMFVNLSELELLGLITEHYGTYQISTDV